MVYQEKVLAAYHSLVLKRTDLIHGTGVYIPSLGANYTHDELTSWLRKRRDFLIQARDLSESEFEQKKDQWLSNLGTQAQAVAIQIMDTGEVPKDLTEIQWEKIVPAILYHDVTTP